MKTKLIYLLIYATLWAGGCRTIQYTAEYLEANPEVAQRIFDKAAAKAKKEFTKKYNKLTKTEQDNIDIQIKAEDHIDYSELQWKYGGFNGSAAIRDTDIAIKNLNTTKNALTYNWAYGTLTLWGATHDHDADHGLACAFVKNNAGEWVGGKFDWISTDRLSRDFDHFYGNPTGYKGWTLHDVPNPTDIAFVIVHPKGGKRTNIIKTTWHR